MRFRRIRRLSTMMVGGSIGAAATYLFDPDRGRSRRARLSDQLQAQLRRARRAGEARARYAKGQAQGRRARAEGAGTPRPVDDVEVVNAVRQALARLDVPTHDINIEVVDGLATLRGQVGTSSEMSRVEQCVREVSGVREVRSFLHLPQTPAPNKATSL
jgi:osmotically-inducible protein OsmY